MDPPRNYAKAHVGQGGETMYTGATNLQQRLIIKYRVYY